MHGDQCPIALWTSRQLIVIRTTGMPQTTNSFTNLFRSSGQNGAELRPANKFGSSGAEQRWPLLKGMPPKEPQPTPALTAQEMQHWQPVESSQQARPATPNTLPGLGELLAQSLKQMSARASAEPKPQVNRSQPTVATPPQSAQLVSMADHPAMAIEENPPAALPKMEIVDAGITLEAILKSKEPTVEPVAFNTAPADDSLKSVFSRLEGKTKQTASSTSEVKKPSYLGRLGKK